jgi:ribosomal protein L3 glutamine methyltransferase
MRIAAQAAMMRRLILPLVSTMSKSKLTDPRTVRDYIFWAERRFDKAKLYFGHGTDNARDEAVWLVTAALHIPFDGLDAQASRLLDAAEQATIRDLVEARVRTRKPLAYLLHEAWFAGLKFYVDERVIVPRSLIGDFIHEQFQPWIDPAGVHRILDLCTGSGCIAIAAAHAFPQAQVDGADLSADALAVARINVERHGLGARVQLVQSDLFQNLAGRRYDLILTNPPYVDAADMATLPAEYQHEPALALASGEQGLDAIVHILAHARAHLNPGGALVAEVGNSQVALAARFPDVPFVWLTSASGDESVFLLSAEELSRHTAQFAAAHPSA